MDGKTEKTQGKNRRDQLVIRKSYGSERNFNERSEKYIKYMYFDQWVK